MDNLCMRFGIQDDMAKLILRVSFYWSWWHTDLVQFLGSSVTLVWLFYLMHVCMRILPSMTYFGLVKLENEFILVFVVLQQFVFGFAWFSHELTLFDCWWMFRDDCTGNMLDAERFLLHVLWKTLHENDSWRICIMFCAVFSQRCMFCMLLASGNGTENFQRNVTTKVTSLTWSLVLPCVVKRFCFVNSSCQLWFWVCIFTGSSSLPLLATLRVTVWFCLVVGSSCW